MNSLALMTGIEIPIPELSISIHQPTIEEISFVGEEAYFTSLQYICFKKEMLIAQNPQGKILLENMNNFQIFMMITGAIEQQPDAPNHKPEVIELFKLFFPNHTLSFLPRSLFLKNLKEGPDCVIDENNFNILQETVQAISGIGNTARGDQSQFNPKGEYASQIAAKLSRARERVSKNKGEANGAVLSRYVSILTIGLNSMSLSQCLRLTVYQLFDLVQRYGLYTAWDIDIRSKLAGGSSNSQPDDWMKNIH